MAPSSFFTSNTWYFCYGFAFPEEAKVLIEQWKMLVSNSIADFNYH